MASPIEKRRLNLQNLSPADVETRRKNHELMMKFLKATEHIEETAMDNEIYKPAKKAFPAVIGLGRDFLPKKKDRYDLLKEGLHEPR